MRSIYLIIAFVSSAIIFFYLGGVFMLKMNSTINDATVLGNNQNSSSSIIQNSSATKKFTPDVFKGPTGKPFIIGPQGPPPSY